MSIARRLQDPLAELVKIDPKSIGVGQYQHDVSQTRLARQLDAVVEDCVNGVGVDVNMASPQLLARISGLSNSLAENIVRHRDTHGAFANRAALMAVSRLGDRAFEQAAGFLRVTGSDNPLDASGVHPEAYPVVQKMLADIKLDLREVIGKRDVIAQLKPERYADERFGLPTVQDILKELEKPGRDPRPEFKTAAFRDGIEKIADLEPGMTLEGVITNVANFGAFVDIGVHQDGLVHISALSEKFVKDPHEVVKAGDLVRVKVLEVDVKRQRIALTMRMSDAAPAARSGAGSAAGSGAGANAAGAAAAQGERPRRRNDRQPAAAQPQSAMAMALASARTAAAAAEARLPELSGLAPLAPAARLREHTLPAHCCTVPRLRRLLAGTRRAHAAPTSCEKHQTAWRETMNLGSLIKTAGMLALAATLACSLAVAQEKPAELKIGITTFTVGRGLGVRRARQGRSRIC